MDRAFERAKSLAGLTDAKLVAYEQPFSFSSLFRIQSAAQNAQIKLILGSTSLASKLGDRDLFLPPTFNKPPFHHCMIDTQKKVATALGKAADVLIIADSEHSADMLYATGMFVPDPFIYLRLKGREYLCMSDLELDRAAKEAPPIVKSFL